MYLYRIYKVKIMPFTRLWRYRIPSECLLDGFEYSDEWLNIDLYCRDEVRKVSIEVTSGRTITGGGSSLELRGVVEFKREYFVLRCFYGYGNVMWSKIRSALDAKIMCRKETCVIGLLRPDNILEVNIINKAGQILETFTLDNVLDFDIGGSRNLIILSTISAHPEHSIVLLVNAISNAVIDEIRGFGGRIISSPYRVIINGKHEGKYYARIYSDEGKELAYTEGIGVFIPYNPYPFQLPGTELYNEKFIVITDLFTVKVYNIMDLGLECSFIKPPRMRAIFNVDLEDNNVTTLSRIFDQPLIVNYSFNGEPLWQTHIVRGVSRVLHSASILALYDGFYRRETRLSLIKMPVVVEEERLGPGVEPLIIWGRYIVLFDGEFIRAYVYER
ncbi:MAG: hypothetical protein DRO40_07625 [Thermoprotei archaeon]|nr:MAG: hypothetical protein DRO40_07625 [Thermoprotei archaeon]